MNKFIKNAVQLALKKLISHELAYSRLGEVSKSLVDGAIDLGWVEHIENKGYSLTSVGRETLIEYCEFNCCEGGVLPDMQLFSNLEVSVVLVGKNGESIVSAGAAAENTPVTRPDCPSLLLPNFENPEFIHFSVFGHYKPTDENEGVEVLHDCSNYEEAMALSNMLNKRFEHLSETQFC